MFSNFDSHISCLSRITLCFALAFCCSISKTSNADEDWKEWGGAQRDFVVEGFNISDQPSVKENWRRKLGNGYSAVLCEGDRLYTMYRDGNAEVMICLDRKTGNTKWERKYDAPLSKDADKSYGQGPNASPIIAGERIVFVGFNSDVHCVSKNDGTVIWKTNLVKDQGGTVVNFGYSASPLVYKENVILPVGGKGKALMAFALKDGAVAWQALDYPNSYGTPLLYRDQDREHLVFASTDNVVAVNPTNGKQIWKFPLSNQWSTHAFVPVWDSTNKFLFISSFRQSHGLRMLKSPDEQTKQTFAKSWTVERTGIGFSNAVPVNGLVVGSTGGTGAPLVTGFDAKTGKVVFKERGFKKANFLAVGDKLVFLDGKGELAIAKPTSAGLNILAKQKVLSAGKVWTAPSMVGNTLFMRDQAEIVSFEIK